jgi:antitoxin component of RelBE/YafQ-DinJ toxin-antitoxin module
MESFDTILKLRIDKETKEELKKIAENNSTHLTVGLTH